MLRSRLIDNIVESKFEHFQNHTIVKNKIDYDSLSLNPNITCNVIRNNLDKPWNWKYFSFHQNITWDIVIKNPDKSWDWESLSANPNITWDIVINNPDKPSLG
jgi:hypothetical protein